MTTATMIRIYSGRSIRKRQLLIVFFISTLSSVVLVHAFPVKDPSESDTVCSDLQNLLDEESSQISSKVICNTKSVKLDLSNGQCNDDLPEVPFLVIVKPETTADVASVVEYIRNYNEVNDISLRISVRSGGHSYTCNSAVANSVHLDLRTWNSDAEIVDNAIDDTPHATEGKLLTFGSGLTFSQLFPVARPSQYSFVHGECASVGVGGEFHGADRLSLSPTGSASELTKRLFDCHSFLSRFILKDTICMVASI